MIRLACISSLACLLQACSSYEAGPARSYVYRDRTLPLKPLTERARPIVHDDLRHLRIIDRVQVDRLGRIATHGDPGTSEHDVFVRLSEAAAASGATHVVIEKRETAPAGGQEGCCASAYGQSAHPLAVARPTAAAEPDCEAEGRDVVSLQAALYRIEDQHHVSPHLRADRLQDRP